MASTALEKLRTTKNLREVWADYGRKAKKAAPGIDGIAPKDFGENLASSISNLHNKLKRGYYYSGLRGVPVPKKDPSKFRLICIPTMDDRIVQRAILRVVESRAKALGIANDVSYGFIKATPEKKRGVAAAREAAIEMRQSKPWAYKADITAFFDRIPRDDLTQRFGKAFALKSLLPLVEGAINCEVDRSDHVISRILRENDIKTGRGLRQGMPLSPILSNFVLRDFDATMAKKGYSLVRYADDLIVLTSSRDECNFVNDLAIHELSKLKLTLSPEKTLICPPDEPVEFLGMELGLKPGSTKYGLSISERQISKIREQFTCYHDLDYVAKQRLDLAKLLRRLDNMKSGYRVAYGLADNRDAFYDQMDDWAKACIGKVYSSIFGPRIIGGLTPQQRDFLMLP
jgi:retron-type reverse transcriptase